MNDIKMGVEIWKFVNEKKREKEKGGETKAVWKTAKRKVFSFEWLIEQGSSDCRGT